MSKINENRILQISEDGLTVEKCLDKTIESIVIPENVKYIGERAFSECENLKTITFPNTLYVIEWAAFFSCDNLEILDFSNTELWKIGANAFAYCRNLKSVDFPQSLSFIGSGAFRRCDNLSDINSLPPKKISIEYNPFEGCPISDFTHQSLKIKNNLIIKDNCITVLEFV